MSIHRRSPRIASRPRRSSRLAAVAKSKELAKAALLRRAVTAAKNKKPTSTTATTAKAKQPVKTRKTAVNNKKKDSSSPSKKAVAKKKKQQTKPNATARKSEAKKRKPKVTAAKKTAKKSKVAATKTTKKASQKKTKATALPESPRRGVVDTETNFDGTVRELDGAPCDVMMALVDPSKNMDKFYVLQLIERSKPINPKSKFTVFMRWGRTGTKGQTMATDYGTFGEASAAFNTKFREKTGLVWKKRSDPTVDGKYRFIEQDYTEKRGGFRTGHWEYYVGDGVDGKRPGWYPYEDDASVQVERLFAEHSNNPRLGTRVVASGYFSYEVNLTNMTQTNVTHPNRKTRKIRRSLKA